MADISQKLAYKTQKGVTRGTIKYFFQFNICLQNYGNIFNKLYLTPPIPIPDEEEKMYLVLFTVIYGASKGFMKAFHKCENKI